MGERQRALAVSRRRQKKRRSKTHNQEQRSTRLFAGDRHGLSAAARGLGVLTTYADAPVVAKTAVVADLLEPLEVLAQLGREVVGEGLHRLAGLPLALPVQEPLGDLELLRALDDGHQLLNLVLGELARPAQRRATVWREQATRSTARHGQPCKTDKTAARPRRSHAPLVGVDLRLLADKVGKPAADTLDLAQGE